MRIEDRDRAQRDYEKRRLLIEEDEEEYEDDGEEEEWEPEEQREKGHIWKWVIIALVILAVLAAALLVIGRTGWGSRFLHREETAAETETAVETEAAAETVVETPTVAATPMPTQTEIPTGIVADQAESNSVVIPAKLVYDGSTQAEHDHFAEEYGLKSVKRGADGSVTLTAETVVPRADIDALLTRIAEKCEKYGWYVHFVSISANEDQTVFTLVVKELVMSEKEKQVITDLFLMAGLHAVQSGSNAESIRIDIANMVGDVISGISTNPVKAENKGNG